MQSSSYKNNQKYSHSLLKCHQRYSLSVDTYQHRSQIEIYIDQSLPLTIKTKCPIIKIIRLANNILKLNLFQCSLLSWLLKKGNIQNKLKQLSQQSFLQGISVLNQPYQKQVLLFIVLNGYHVKSNFVMNGAQVDIDPIILQNIKNFRSIYRDWKPQKSVKNISHNQVNRIFQTWNQRKSNHIIKSKVDYNKIVDKILILSKTYNVGNADDAQSVRDTHTNRQNKKQQNHGNKKRKINQINQTQDIKFKYCQQKQIICDQSPLKNSVSNKIPWFEDNNDIMQLRRSQRSMNRNIYDLRLSQDPNGNNMFQSMRSQESDMMNSLRNTNNGKYFNLNNSFINLNNQSMGLNNQSMGGGFGSLFKSSLQNDLMLPNNNEINMKKSITKKMQTSSAVKLKPTISYDQFK